MPDDRRLNGSLGLNDSQLRGNSLPRHVEGLRGCHGVRKNPLQHCSGLLKCQRKLLRYSVHPGQDHGRSHVPSASEGPPVNQGHPQQPLSCGAREYHGHLLAVLGGLRDVQRGEHHNLRALGVQQVTGPHRLLDAGDLSLREQLRLELVGRQDGHVAQHLRAVHRHQLLRHIQMPVVPHDGVTHVAAVHLLPELQDLPQA
mmetsp:Transcript_98221/g.233767  ORF Transcript_98221/g.233767 Transcript_98221/m.233767 type:complete len:200 (-) Transcript_98221:328-927(-)